MAWCLFERCRSGLGSNQKGGPGAPDDLQKGFETQAWLAVSNDEKARVSGQYFYHQAIKKYNLNADDIALQEKFLTIYEDISGVPFPE